MFLRYRAPRLMGAATGLFTPDPGSNDPTRGDQLLLDRVRTEPTRRRPLNPCCGPLSSSPLPLGDELLQTGQIVDVIECLTRTIRLRERRFDRALLVHRTTETRVPLFKTRPSSGFHPRVHRRPPEFPQTHRAPRSARFVFSEAWKQRRKALVRSPRVLIPRERAPRRRTPRHLAQLTIRQTGAAMSRGIPGSGRGSRRRSRAWPSPRVGTPRRTPPSCRSGMVGQNRVEHGRGNLIRYACRRRRPRAEVHARHFAAGIVGRRELHVQRDRRHRRASPRRRSGRAASTRAAASPAPRRWKAVITPSSSSVPARCVQDARHVRISASKRAARARQQCRAEVERTVAVG